MIKTYSLKTHKNQALSKNFKVSEFACKDGSDIVLIDTNLIEVLQKIRDHFEKPVTINSAYRNPEYNKKVGGVSNSQHTKGTASDIVVKNIKPIDVANYAEYLLGDKGGIGLYSNFVHIDTRGKRARWENYGREKSVDGFFGYKDVPQSAKYHIEGITHIVEIDPRNIFAVETQCSTKNIPYYNFVNSIFFMAQKNGIAHPQGIMVNAGQILANNATHGKPVATLIVYSKDGKRLKEYYSSARYHAAGIGFPFALFANEKMYESYGDRMAAKFALIKCVNEFIQDYNNGFYK
jgi:hypothetical protein